MIKKITDNKKMAFLYVLYFAIICFLCFNFYPIVDDLVFAGKIKYHQWTLNQIMTVHGVNGRYLGNTLGVFFSWLSTTPLWPFRAVFNIICIALLLVFIIKATGINRISLLYIPVFMLTPNIYHFHQYYGFSADFMNYLLPLLLLFINYDLIKLYIKKHSKMLFYIIPITVFLNCFFIEHITVYIVCCCIISAVYAAIKKKDTSFFIFLASSSFIGLVCMFLHSFVYPSNSGYRESVLSNGITWILSNITDNINFVVFDHLFLTGFSSLICFICMIKFSKNNRTKKLLSFIITAVLAFSCICSFCLYFDNWQDTVLSIIINKYFVTILTILFILSVGIVIFVFVPKAKIAVDTYFIYASIWFICAMLSVVSPLGPRCFMIIYVFMAIIMVRLFSTVSEQMEKHLKSAVIIGCLLFFSAYMFDVCHAYYVGKKVMDERFEHIEEQMIQHAETIELPDSVNFTDSGGLNFMSYLYYYDTPEDIEFIFVANK